MTYIENIFLCLAIPLILSLFFTGGRARSFTLFIVAGMLCCLLSAYVSSFFMGYCGANARQAVVEITPVCEEIITRHNGKLEIGNAEGGGCVVTIRLPIRT